MIINKLTTAAILLAICVTGAAQQTPENRFIIEPYVQHVTDSSFHIMWETSDPCKDIVYFGSAELNVLKPFLKPVQTNSGFSNFHNIEITGLIPGSAYFYKVVTVSESGDTLIGPVTPFNIPDYKKSPVSFAVISDTQNNPKVWGKLAGLIYRERPNFIIHAGDLVQYGPHKDDWVEEFFKPAKELFRYYPLYPAIGNHEGDNDWYYRYFDLPAPEWFYTIKKGDALFIFTDTNKDILPGSPQYIKLERILASAEETWKILVHHHPVYTSDEKSYGNTWYQLAKHGDPNEMHLKDLYETYGVDMVLNGHVHTYERTWPLYKDKVDKEHGVTYITLGGGGGSLDKAAANKTWYAAKTRNTHHFLNVSIANQTLYAQAVDTSGNIFDYWTIEKPKDYSRLNAPLITATKQYFIDSTTAVIRNLNVQAANLTVSGIEKESITSQAREVRIPISETTVISAYTWDKSNQSVVSEKKIEKLNVFPALKRADKKVKADYYEGNWISLPDFSKEKAIRSFSLDSVTLTAIQPRVGDHFAVKFRGSFSITSTDVYRFLLESFDGSKLFIDGNEVINNDGIHYEISIEAFVALEKGLHTFEVQYFDFMRRETLNLLVGTQTGEMMSFNRLIVK